ncbi:MAG: UDP-N-acetylmuramoyl-L-alanyl-D-glutamate--2,6-diaminopimelate ligase [Treponema sp.]|jgi:UDP-N-acetylmuramoyl-L-alanyl-D-glutamate--2,6-diaminopimelate ligase|nr:UDP-N-acetylmuramoyl-L-alanyl-D-glutamate--2,6-diaminopimelate ligase [Treponema sp.]
MENRIKRRLSDFFTPETAARAGLIELYGGIDPFIASLEYDSRKAGPQTLYFALPGLHTDGHRYINDAISRGAVAIIHEAEISEKKADIAYIKVKNSRFAMSPVAAAFYDCPSRRLFTAGVTGTEGKSTCVYLIWQLLRLAGKKAGFISTVQYSDGGIAPDGGGAQWNKEHQTTPEAPEVQRKLWEMAENGCEYAVVEASSHGLSPRTNRLGDVEFDAALFTNVTHEHLEFHGTWEQYRDDKANLFRALDRGKKNKKNMSVPESFGVINADDPSADYFSNVTKSRKMSFSVKGTDAGLTVKALESSAAGNRYNVLIASEKACIDISDKLPGAFNAGNVLASLLVVSGLTGIPVRDLARLCPRLLPVRGRMTSVDRGQSFEVLVDYAHTPSSFQTIFPPLRERLDRGGVAGSRRRIISLFGSAGERDTHKRAEQGKIAARYSDIIILTDEDPRGEVPLDILEEIARGVFNERPDSFKRNENILLIPDRPAAIRKAFSLAREGDLVLLLGKGHENTIIYKDCVMPYDEIGEAEKALDERKEKNEKRSRE